MMMTYSSLRYGLALVALLSACDGGASPAPDAATLSSDAPALADAATSPITAACMHLCDALGACSGEPRASCTSDCEVDLADCSQQQVVDVDACKSAACGDEKGSPIIDCIRAVGCVDM